MRDTEIFLKIRPNEPPPFDRNQEEPSMDKVLLWQTNFLWDFEQGTIGLLKAHTLHARRRRHWKAVHDSDEENMPVMA